MKLNLVVRTMMVICCVAIFSSQSYGSSILDRVLGKRPSGVEPVAGTLTTPKKLKNISKGEVPFKTIIQKGITRIFDPNISQSRVEKGSVVVYKSPRDFFENIQSGDNLVLLGRASIDRNIEITDSVMSGSMKATIDIPPGLNLKFINSRVENVRFRGGAGALAIKDSIFSSVKIEKSERSYGRALLPQLPLISEAYAGSDNYATLACIEVVGGVISNLQQECDDSASIGILVTGDAWCDGCNIGGFQAGFVLGPGSNTKPPISLDLKNSKVSGNFAGIQLTKESPGGTTLTLDNTEISSNVYGIFAEDGSSADITITNSNIINNNLQVDGTGVLVLAPENLSISNSEINNNPTGIYSEKAKQINIDSSVVENSKMQGMLLYESSLTVNDNKFKNDGIGILIGQGSSIYAKGNSFMLNGEGIEFYPLVDTEGKVIEGDPPEGVIRENFFNLNDTGIVISFGAPNLGMIGDYGINMFIDANKCNIFNKSGNAIYAYGNYWDFTQAGLPTSGSEIDKFNLCVGKVDIVNDNKSKTYTNIVDELGVEFIQQVAESLKEFQLEKAKGMMKLFGTPQ